MKKLAVAVILPAALMFAGIGFADARPGGGSGGARGSHSFHGGGGRAFFYAAPIFAGAYFASRYYYPPSYYYPPNYYPPTYYPPAYYPPVAPTYIEQPVPSDAVPPQSQYQQPQTPPQSQYQQPQTPPQDQYQPEPQAYWYYCQASSGYYPHVQTCPGGWQRVSPQSPPR